MDWIIAGIVGLFIGFFGMAILSGRAYDKGKADAEHTLSRFDMERQWNNGYRSAMHDFALADKLADEVVFTSKTENEGDWREQHSISA